MLHQAGGSDLVIWWEGAEKIRHLSDENNVEEKELAQWNRCQKSHNCANQLQEHPGPIVTNTTLTSIQPSVCTEIDFHVPTKKWCVNRAIRNRRRAPKSGLRPATHTTWHEFCLITWAYNRCKRKGSHKLRETRLLTDCSWPFKPLPGLIDYHNRCEGGSWEAISELVDDLVLSTWPVQKTPYENCCSSPPLQGKLQGKWRSRVKQ